MIKTTPATRRKVRTDQVDVPLTSATFYQVLYGRRTTWNFKAAPVPRATVQRLLNAAIWAPNHRLTEPWRFFILEKEGVARRQVADLAYDYALQRSSNPLLAEVVRRKVSEPPQLVYVYSVPGADEEVTRENYAAVCCAINNLCLAAVAEGLAAGWHTGGATRHPLLAAALGAAEDWTVAGMLAVGFAPDRAPHSRRTPADAYARWLD